MLDFRIDTFLTVCRCLNFTRAAEELHITQPAVSQHIRYLETRYGAALFFHEGKKIRLTHAGELLYTTATTLKNDERFMEEQMRQARPSPFPLVFGVTMTIGEYVIAAPLAGYLKKHPDTNVKIIPANTTELLERLQAGDIHFALVEGYFDRESYDYLTYRPEAFIPVCAAEHKFAAPPAALRDLLAERLIVREEGSGTRDILERRLAVDNIRLSDFARRAEVGSMHTIIQLLSMDCGISFLYQTAVSGELSSGRLKKIPLSDFDMTHDFTFLWNKNSIFAENYRAVCLELKAAAVFSESGAFPESSAFPGSGAFL